MALPHEVIDLLFLLDYLIFFSFLGKNSTQPPCRIQEPADRTTESGGFLFVQGIGRESIHTTTTRGLSTRQLVFVCMDLTSTCVGNISSST